MSPKAICPACTKEISKSGSVCCSICDSWYHRKACSNLTTAAFEFLVANLNTVRWRCVSCAAFTPKTDGTQQIWEAITKLTEKVESMMQSLPGTVRTEVDKCLSALQESIATQSAKCDEQHVHVEEKFKMLDKENHRLRHQLNRNDILVSGLPCDAVPLNLALKIPAAVGVNVTMADINTCFWLGKAKKTLLLKFTSQHVRDNVMSKYMKGKNLNLRQVTGADIESRVYLNDNLPPAAVKLKNTCRRMLKDKLINSYKLVPSIPAVNISYPDGTRSFLSLDQLINSNASQDFHFRRQRGGRGNPEAPPEDEFGTPRFGQPQ